MHGVQKEITIPFIFENNVFKGSIQVNRLDYNINVAANVNMVQLRSKLILQFRLQKHKANV